MFKWHYESSCEVDIPIVPLWDFSVDPTNWPKFIDEFKSCELETDFQKDSIINVKVRNTHIPILITDVKYLKKYQYEIKPLFFFQQATTIFEKISPTRTKITSLINVTSFLTPFLKSYYRKKVDRQYAKFLEVIAVTDFNH